MHRLSFPLCLLLLSAVHTAAAAPIEIKKLPEDVRTNALTDGKTYLLLPGQYTATDTGALDPSLPKLSNGFDSPLVLANETLLTVKGSDPDKLGLGLTSTLQIVSGSTLDTSATGGGWGTVVSIANPAALGTFETVFFDSATLNVSAAGKSKAAKPEDEYSSVGFLIYRGNVYADKSAFNITAKNNGYGMVLEFGGGTQAGSFFTDGSTVNITAVGSANDTDLDTVGLMGYNVNAAKSQFNISASNNAIGAQVWEWTTSDGSVITTSANDDSVGIDAFRSYKQSGGTLTLGQGSGTALQVGENAAFNATSRVVVQADAADPTNAGKIVVLGKSTNTGAPAESIGKTTITNGAEVSIKLTHSTQLKKGQSIDITFLESPTIEGQFTGDKSLSNFDLSVKDGTLTVTRVQNTSDSLSGPNSNLAQALENNASDERGYQGADRILSALDNARSDEEKNTVARRSNGWQTAKLAGITFSHIDLGQNLLSGHLSDLHGYYRLQAAEQGTMLGQFWKKRSDWQRWFSWNANANHFGGNGPSYGSLDAKSGGLNVGMARKTHYFGRNANAGFNVSYNYGGFGDSKNSRDQGVTAGHYNGFSFLTASRSDISCRSIWTELTAGFSYNEYGLKRTDVENEMHASTIGNGLVRIGWAMGRDLAFRTHEHYIYYEGCRITPILGVDYTFLGQTDYRENNYGNGLALNGGGDTLHSFRGKAGLEFEYRYTELTVALRSYLRYDFTGSRLHLPTSFSTAPLVRYDLSSQPCSGLSGVLGFNVGWQLTERNAFAIAYDGVIADNSGEHWVDLQFIRRF